MVRPILLDRCLSVSLSVHPSCPVRNIGVLWPNGWMDQDETWHGSRPQPRPHYVRRGPSSPKRGTVPQFSAHVCCGQTAGWTKMPLGREVGLCTGLIVLYGNPAPPKKGAQQPPLFGPYLFWPNGCPSLLLLSTCTCLCRFDCYCFMSSLTSQMFMVKILRTVSVIILCYLAYSDILFIL